MDGSARGAFGRLVPNRTSEPQALDGMAAIERQLEERLARLTAGTQEFLDAPGRLHFCVDGQQYSTALSGLREALTALPAVSPLPFSPPWLLGLFPLRTDFVPLVDLRAVLHGVRKPHEANDAEPAYIEQALLVGEDGRLLAFGVDRIGQISSPGAPHANGGGASYLAEPLTRYIEGYFPSETPGASTIIALNLTLAHEDVIAQLEDWSHHV
jgi:chemotaxis signal transduction protein